MLLFLISMHDLTKEERAEAAAQGWGLFHIYDMQRQRWHMNVLPLAIGPDSTVMGAMNHVLSQARFNHPLSIKALRLMSQFNANKQT